jgi:hypothetical protein
MQSHDLNSTFSRRHSKIFNDLKFKIPMTMFENSCDLPSKFSSPEFRINHGPNSNAPSCYDIPEGVVAITYVFKLVKHYAMKTYCGVEV